MSHLKKISYVPTIEWEFYSKNYSLIMHEKVFTFEEKVWKYESYWTIIGFSNTEFRIFPNLIFCFDKKKGIIFQRNKILELTKIKIKALKIVKFIYSEKATKFCEISTLLLSYVVLVKCKVEISQNFVVFSEYMNFNYRN